MNLIRWIGKGAIILGIVSILPNQLKSQNSNNVRLKFKADTIFFEPVVAGVKVHLTYQFAVQGDSSQKTKIHQVYTGCSCTATEYNDDSMNAGDLGKVDLTFDSEEWGADTGYLVNKHIYVIYNGGSQVVFLQGRVFSKDTLSKIRYSKKLHDFGEITHQIRVSYTFVIYNDNFTPIRIENVRTSGGPLVKWSKDMIHYGDSSLIHVAFGAGNMGRFSKVITVSTNLGNQILRINGEVIE